MPITRLGMARDGISSAASCVALVGGMVLGIKRYGERFNDEPVAKIDAQALWRSHH